MRRARCSAAATAALAAATAALAAAATAFVAAATAFAAADAEPAATAASSAVDASLQAVGAGPLLVRETARMRDALATAALGGDHELLVARKRSTDWAFLATALTVAVAAGARSPAELIGSVADCDATSHRAGDLPARGSALLAHALASPPDAARDGVVPGAVPGPSARPALQADAITFSELGAGSDFPCAIRWRITVDGSGVHARVLWHEPMLALRAIDVPLLPDRTAIDLGPDVVRVRCWGYGMRADPWPDAPAHLDQVGDAYDFADAARHWWWSRAPVLAATPASRGVALALPECDVIRHAPWRVTARHAAGESFLRTPSESTERASVSVPLREQPATLALDDGGESIGLKEESPDGTMRVLRWRMSDAPRSGPWPDPAWQDAQLHIAAAQDGGAHALVPHALEDITGPDVDESVAHARATAHVWHMASAGDAPGLSAALAAADSVRRARGLPASLDAMALASLAESLAMRDAPHWAVATAVMRHAIMALSLPVDAAAARAAWGGTEIAPSLDQQRYGLMLRTQGRHWAAGMLGERGVAATATASRAERSGRLEAEDPIVTRFNDTWIALAPRRSDEAAGTAPASAARDDLDVGTGTAKRVDAGRSDA